MKNSIALSYISMGLAWMLWAMDPILIRVIGDDVSRPLMAGISSLLAGIVLLYPAIKGYRFLAKRRDLWLGFGSYILFGTVLANLCYVIAIRNMNPGLVGLILRSQVAMIILSAWIFWGERPNGTVLTGLCVVALGYAGTAYFMKPASGLEIQRNPVLGWICAIGAAGLWTSGTLLGKRLMEKIQSSHLCGMRLLTAGIVTCLAHICFGGGGEYLALSGRQWVIIVLKSAFCTAFSYALYMYGLHLAPVTAAAAMEQAAPLLTLCVSAFLLHENIAAAQWLTVAVVFAGAAIILVNQYRKSQR